MRTAANHSVGTLEYEISYNLINGIQSGLQARQYSWWRRRYIINRIKYDTINVVKRDRTLAHISASGPVIKIWCQPNPLMAFTKVNTLQTQIVFDFNDPTMTVEKVVDEVIRQVNFAQRVK